MPRCGSALLAAQSWLNKGIREFREGVSKQAHLLCQNYISSVRLLRITYLEDYIPWSQVFILHLWVNQSMTVSVMLMLTCWYFLVKIFFSSKTAWCLIQV